MSKNPDAKNQPLTVRFPPKIYAILEKLAEAETRSINEQVLHFVKMGLREDDPEIDNGQKAVIEKETDAINK